LHHSDRYYCLPFTQRFPAPVHPQTLYAVKSPGGPSTSHTKPASKRSSCVSHAPMRAPSPACTNSVPCHAEIDLNACYAVWHTTQSPPARLPPTQPKASRSTALWPLQPSSLDPFPADLLSSFARALIGLASLYPANHRIGCGTLEREKGKRGGFARSRFSALGAGSRQERNGHAADRRCCINKAEA
jgi:hypothetical protein